MIAFHLWPFTVTGGYLGVDVFFVLSGYLITSLLLDEWRASGRIRLGAFWTRRARRLLPALLLLLAAARVYVALYDGDSQRRFTRPQIVASLFYVTNWWNILHPHLGAKVLDHLWSLAVEEQFYLVWPLLLTVCLRARRPLAVLAGTGVAMFAASLVCSRAFATNYGLEHAYAGTDARAFEILAGALLAVVQAHVGRRPSARTGRLLRAGGVAGLAGIAAIVLTAPAWNAVATFPGWMLLLSVSVVAVIAGCVTAPGVASRVLSMPPLILVGRVSYGLYLWHWPIFWAAREQRLHVSVGVSLAITVAITLVSYRCVELPVRRFGSAPRKAEEVDPLPQRLAG